MHFRWDTARTTAPVSSPYRRYVERGAEEIRLSNQQGIQNLFPKAMQRLSMPYDSAQERYPLPLALQLFWLADRFDPAKALSLYRNRGSLTNSVGCHCGCHSSTCSAIFLIDVLNDLSRR